ncbi:uracil-DNA glycosylase [Halothiobacillus diazotrophicus]|uniref:Uracil-DNA glycosylase n=1 Tax=Halothiobacillus diazotrophicus TaxID=1860122 RepID=A0A191ZI73_9GAMM|nr:uracil-DNA glycosylase [Halothiobacillus diazotrophicus]ANJ67552.1 uracil-DNA glycosylase [Halothiobacillus diazotrophicus]
MTEAPPLEPGWWAQLASVFATPPIDRLRDFLRTELRSGKQLLPAKTDWFNAFAATPFDRVRVVILGQDPYPTPGHAHGLSFSVRRDVRPLPKSLVNIFQELADDLGIRNTSGDLTPWADQGVLLLNAVLTVPARQPAGHQNQGWELITDAAISALAAREKPVVFVLWGAAAQRKAALIAPHNHNQRHLIIQSPHPSPLSAYRGFFGSRPFSRINDFLQQHGEPPIDWRT